jgi:hypothetical protein
VKALPHIILFLALAPAGSFGTVGTDEPLLSLSPGSLDPPLLHDEFSGAFLVGDPFGDDPFGDDPFGDDPFGGDPFGGAPTAPAPAVHTFTRSPNLTPFNPLFPNLQLQPRSFDINTPSGAIRIEILPASSISSLAPREPDDPRGIFRPPSFFSAPLPTGSGARALGFSGSFTAIADDATAASWNPAGLLNLETPEASIVYRRSSTRNRHTSTDPDFQPSDSRYDSEGINYVSVVLPLYHKHWQRNLVVSLNHQEAYDFEHDFSARVRDANSQTVRDRRTGVASGVQEDTFTFEGGRFDVSVLTTVTTRSESSLEQFTRTTMESDLRFRQSGVIEASTPAFAIELTPKISIGAAANFYQDSPLPGRGIESRTGVDYRIRQDTRARVVNRQTTTASYLTQAVEHVPGLPPFFPPFDVQLADETGDFEPFSDEQVINSSSSRVIDGRYEQIDTTENLDGVNGTFGVLCTLNRFFVLGLSLDLPWTAEGDQTRVIRNTLSENGGPERVSETREQRRVEYDFPMFCNAGLVFRVNDRFYTSFDASFTQWSEFAFDSGEGPVNPFNGTSDAVDDTLSWRLGAEYLFLLESTEIPLRAGLLHEERPAVGAPDVYHGFSLGSGVSLGRDPGKLIFDVAYSYLEADDVQTVIPDQPGLTTDSRQHQVYASLIWHF